MANIVTIRVDGLRQLGERMRKLNFNVATKFGYSATGAGANVIKKLAKAKVGANSVDTGLVQKNIISKRLAKRDTTLTSEHIVTVKKIKYPADNQDGRRQARRTASFLEFGTTTEFGTVKMAAEPFLRPAFDEGKEKAVEAIKARLLKQIEKAGG